MSVASDVLLVAVEKSKATWDFEGTTRELRDAIAAVQADATLLDVGRRPLVQLGAVALRALEERRKSPEHLIVAVDSALQGLGGVSPEDLKPLAGWFFNVAYSGAAIEPELETMIRPILNKTQGDPSANAKRLRGDFERYRRLAEWGVDLALTDNNLRGLLAASRVLALEADVAERLREGASKALSTVAVRRAMGRVDLLKDGVARCQGVIAKTWRDGGGKGSAYLSQDDTFALHICLNGLHTALSVDEALPNVEELSDEVHALLAKFQQIRYRSSTTLLARVKVDLAELDSAVDRSLDFALLREQLKEVQKRINDSRRGTRGVNWMYGGHADEALSVASAIYNKIKTREASVPDFERELQLIDEAIVALENASVSPAAGQLKRWMARVKKDSLLARWVPLCCKTSGERRQAEQRLHGLRQRLNALWDRMLSEEGRRVAEFRLRCATLRAEVGGAQNPAMVLSEILELGAAGREEFSRTRLAEIQQEIEAVFIAFRDRVSDVDAFSQTVEGLEEEIARNGRRLLRFIDFDDLLRRASEVRRWAALRDFPQPKRAEALARVNRLFGDVRKLRFRQERAKAELEAKAERIVSELRDEIEEVRKQVLERPGRQETWHALVEMDSRLSEYARHLSDQQRRDLKALIDDAFQTVKASRARFAAEAAKVFAGYNEVLSDTLFSLEEEPSRDVAFEAIERIKPLRLALKDERRLLRHQRQELLGVLNSISSAISEVLDKAAAQSAQEASRLRGEIERLEGRIASADSWRAANELIGGHKDLSAQLRDSQVSIGARKELRLELDRLWDDVAERLRVLRSTRDTGEDLNQMMERLERKGYLVVVSAVPTIA